MSAEATLSRGGALLHVSLQDPKANVLSMAMMAEVEHALERHRAHADLKLVVVRGAGGNFSFGASVPEHRRESAPRMLASFHRLVRTVASYPVPVAALVEGSCLGGAFELVLACSLVFATDTARFACPEVKLGVLPPVLCAIGHQRLGGPLADRMILTGAALDAERAAACGLVTERVPPNVDAEAWLLGWFDRELAPLSAFSLREATWAARRGSGILERLGAPLDALEARYLERLLPSHDGNEGIEAFLAKRAPAWTGA